MRPPEATRGLRAPALLIILSVAILIVAPLGPAIGDDDEELDEDVLAASRSCLGCHEGIEEMHPAYPLGCTDCHGGDASSDDQERSHIQPKRKWPNDESVLKPNHDPAYVKFRNPANLRVVKEACGGCHDEEVDAINKSLHGTTAGHLNDGLFENGVLKKKGSKYAIFGIRDDRPAEERDEFALAKLDSLPGFRSGKPNAIPTHIRDVPRKACMRCHLWGVGRAVRGRLGMDGDYRSEGCAACHVTYADDGLSQSADEAIDKLEPGHPMKHTFTNKIPTETCTRCHYGDASIGMHFRGMAQLVPGMPAGPQVPQTTDHRLNGSYYYKDPNVTPPDIHHEKGLACIDCHTFKETMGDGNIYGAMEHALEVECEDCHGSFTKRADFETKKGTKLKHLRREGKRVILTSKVTGKEHEVTQLVDVLDPKSDKYNKRAAEAMTSVHGDMRCHSCHTSWNVNFFGFHMDRNATFTQLDQLAGKRTDGRVTTLEKVFATFKQFTLGYDSMGHIAPYLVGFSTMCTAVDSEGRTVLDQALPETANGLSGLTMIHHHVHTVRNKTRTCVECHRSPTTWGTGSPHYKLMRRLVVAGTGRSLEVWRIDRKSPAKSVKVATVDLPQVNDVALQKSTVSGYVEKAFVATKDGLGIVDMDNPAAPRLLGILPTTNAQGVALAAGRIYLADGAGGLRIYELGKKGKPKEIGSVKTADARAVFIDGLEAFVADGTAGLKIISIAEPSRPKIIADLRLNPNKDKADEAMSLTVFFQYSRHAGGSGGRDRERTPARRLCFVANGTLGMACIDVTEPSRPFHVNRGAYARMGGRDRNEARAVVSGSLFDLGSEDGGIPTIENDYIYVAVGRKNNDGNEQDGRLAVIKVSNPAAPQVVNAETRLNNWSRDVAVAHVYNPPFLQHFTISAVGAGGDVSEVSRSNQPNGLGLLAGDNSGLPQNRRSEAWWRCVVVEDFPLDKMIDEDATALKDISHDGARYVNRKELEKLLGADLPDSAFAGRGGGGGGTRPGRRRGR